VHWTLEYPGGQEPVNHAFFEQLRQVEISSVLHFVQRQCRFLDAFEHLLGRYIKQSVDIRTLIACLLAWGTNTGLSKMGEISDISYATLLATSETYIRLETLRAANDLVSNALAALPIFRHYDLNGRLHSKQLPENLSRKGCAPIIREPHGVTWGADIFVVVYSGDHPYADPQTALSR